MTDLDRDYVRGPHRSAHFEENLEWFQSTRDLAETVLCSQCRSEPGRTCVNPITQLPLGRFPAHEVRLRAAQKKQEAKK